MRVGWQPATVREVIRQTPSAATLMLDVPGWPGHRAGQHADIRLTAEDGYSAQRSYSIASAPEDGYAAITVERLDDGEVSPYLVDDAQVGDEMEIRGPVGGWFVWDARDGGPLMLVAGGSGVVPLRSMLRHRALAGSDADARLLLSARRAEDVIYREELTDAIITYTREAPDGWTGYARRVDRDMLAEVAFAPGERPRVYVCGGTGFVESVAADLVALGHHADQIRIERFGATGG
ncbi:MAG TPA: ferredoxin reductase [Solirubrobacteraceae bacterium]|nr:ferredoxin reductase [Solirubrobacteraceae bacterium]